MTLPIGLRPHLAPPAIATHLQLGSDTVPAIRQPLANYSHLSSGWDTLIVIIPKYPCERVELGWKDNSAANHGQIYDDCFGSFIPRLFDNVRTSTS